nr:major capsid protein [uncultured Prevotella sp.]
MMNAPLFDLDVPGMQVTVNSYKPGNGLAWPTLFPLKYTPKFDLKGIEGDEGIPVSADRVAFNAKAPQKTRRKVGTWSGELSKIAVKRVRNEKEITAYNDLKVIAASNSDPQTAQYLVDTVYDDVDFVNSAMDYKNEIDCMRIASLGIQTFPANIEGDMASQDIINFNIPAKHFLGVKNKWSGIDNGDGIGDIVNAQNMIAKEGAPKPRFVYLEKAKFDELCAENATARRLFPQVKDLSVVTADMIDITSINAYMAKKSYPQILVLDTYATIEHKDGSKETIKPWNPNVVTLSPTIQLGWTYYKPVPIVPNVEAVQVYASYYKVTSYSDLDPMVETTMAEAYIQPAFINRQSLVFINTDNTKWADGVSA